MATNDPIADMLTRMRNAISAGHSSVRVPGSRIKADICAVLKREGFIRDFRSIEQTRGYELEIALKYLPDHSCVIRRLRRISKPSLRSYLCAEDIRPVCSGLGIAILSTSKGVMTGKQARAARVGGEVLCEVW